MQLKQKIVQGGFFLALANVLGQFVSIGVNIILATLLAPEDFGLVALSTTYIGFITIFTTIGFGSAIIYNTHSTQQQLSTLFWLNLLLGFFSFVVVAATAPLASRFYEEPRLLNVVLFAAITILMYPFFIIHYKIKERDLEFKLLSRINLISLFIGAVVSVIAAFQGAGVYALVLQAVVATVFRLILTLYHSDWKPSWTWELAPVRGMIWYSVRYKLATTALFLERNVDYLVLGKIFSSRILGYYSFAYNIMYSPVKRISSVFSDVMFPSLSSIKDNPEKVISGYFKSKQLIAIVAFPGMTLLALNAEWLIITVFGTKWEGAIPIVEILCFAGAIQAISQVGDMIFSSIGKPEVAIFIASIRTVLTASAIFIGSLQGILFVAYYLVIAKALSYFILLLGIYRFIPFSFLKLGRVLSGPLITSMILFASHIIYERGSFGVEAYWKLIVMIVVATIFSLAFHFKDMRELYFLLRAKVAK